MLDFRDSGQEIENDGFDKDFNKEMWVPGNAMVLKHWANAGFQGFWSGDRK